MESFRWDDHFITGLKGVDNQHLHLVKMVNKFGALLAKDELVLDDVELLYQELAEYAQYHFEEEELLMSETGVDPRHSDEHIDAHKNFLQEVTFMHDGISADNPDTAKHLLDFLTHWLAYHILGSDQNMAKQIIAIESGLKPGEAYEAEERGVDNATEPLLVALNSLFEQVTFRNRELILFNQSLEEKVAKRTEELSQANLHLEELALTDVLTGLPNRRHAMRCLADLWEESTRTKQPIVCMMIDADHFKGVNDTYGHDAGDSVLCELAKALQQGFRTDDVVCRLGGDEFFIICPDTDKAGGMKAAESTRKAVSELRVPTGDGFWCGSVSIGVAIRSSDISNFEELIKAADKGVYAAKEQGKNCVKTVC